MSARLERYMRRITGASRASQLAFILSPLFAFMLELFSQGGLSSLDRGPDRKSVVDGKSADAGGGGGAEDGIRDGHVTGVQTCALPISSCPSSGCVGGAAAIDVGPP